MQLTIRRNIKSCVNIDQLLTCVHWIMDLSRRGYIIKKDYLLLSSSIRDKWMDITGYTDSNDLLT